jgi:acetate kinase
MSDKVLTLNAGSSSLKFALFDQASLACDAIGQIEGLGTDPELKIKNGAGNTLLKDALEGDRMVADHGAALSTILAALRHLMPDAQVRAVGHRIVHGGLTYAQPLVLTDAILADLAKLAPLAPLHQPHNLSGVAAAKIAFPDAPQVGCFDTAFHRAHPFVSDAFAIPRELYDEGIRRYGFHGLSYEYVSGRLKEIAPYHHEGRVVICHLGSGASMCGLRRGQSIASKMGFSALDGLPMGTRPGQLDPGVLLYLMDEKGMSGKQISDLLYKQSGLKGLSGVSNDMRDLLASKDPKAQQAVDYFVFRVRREIGAMAAVLEGLDAIVFTGGIGENAAPIREYVLEAMEWIGVELDLDRNRAGTTIISSDRSRVRVFVIPTNEELMIVRHTLELMSPVAKAAAA